MLSLVGIFSKVLDLFKYSDTAGFPESYTTASVFKTGGYLSPVIAKDLGFTGAGLPATIAEALGVPPIHRAIALYSTCIAQVKIPDAAPSWVRTGVGSITPEARLVSIVLDLIFYRDSVVMLDRQGDEIVSGVRLPYDLWHLDPVGNIMIPALYGGEIPDQSMFIYLSSYMPLGLLEAASETIEHYHDLKNTIRSRGKNPIPLVELSVTAEFDGSEGELIKARDDWTEARQDPNGAVAFTPPGVELKTPGADSANDGGAMLIQARNAVRLDAANFCNLPAALLEGANGASGTYENTLQTKDELVSLSCAQWLTPVASRLSQPDAGSTAPWVFDTSALSAGDAKGNTGTAVATPTQGEITA